MIVTSLLIVSGLLVLVVSFPTPSKSELTRFINKGFLRPARSFGVRHVFPATHFELWTENPLPLIFPPLNIPLEVTIENKKYFTPDYGYGDPYLLTGQQAKKATDYLYSKELFFEDVPHLNAVMRNQELRRNNGLSGHLLSSIRINSPFPVYRQSKRLIA